MKTIEKKTNDVLEYKQHIYLLHRLRHYLFLYGFIKTVQQNCKKWKKMQKLKGMALFSLKKSTKGLK